MIARYPGECAECGGRFDAGDDITATLASRYCATPPPFWRHTDCPEPAADKPTRFEGTTDVEMGY